MTAAPRQPRDARQGRLEVLVLWTGLAFAFSPALVDLLRHMAEHPWARYAALFPFLFARSALTRPDRPPVRRDGILMIGVGIGLELLGVLASIPQIGRVGLALAAMGLCRLTALADWRQLLLLALAVPLPSAAFGLTSPVFELALASAASGCLDALGLGGIQIAEGAARYGDQELILKPFDGGAALVPLLAGVSWYGSLLLDIPVKRAMVLASWAVLLAFPVQMVAIAFALLSLPLGSANVGRWALSEVLWLVVAGVSLAMIERRVRRGESEREI